MSVELGAIMSRIRNQHTVLKEKGVQVRSVPEFLGAIRLRLNIGWDDDYWTYDDVEDAAVDIAGFCLEYLHTRAKEKQT